MGYWNFDEMYGQTAYDKSQNEVNADKLGEYVVIAITSIIGRGYLPKIVILDLLNNLVDILYSTDVKEYVKIIDKVVAIVGGNEVLYSDVDQMSHWRDQRSFFACI